MVNRAVLWVPLNGKVLLSTLLCIHHTSFSSILNLLKFNTWKLDDCARSFQAMTSTVSGTAEGSAQILSTLDQRVGRKASLKKHIFTWWWTPRRSSLLLGWLVTLCYVDPSELSHNTYLNYYLWYHFTYQDHWLHQLWWAISLRLHSRNNQDICLQPSSSMSAIFPTLHHRLTLQRSISKGHSVLGIMISMQSQSAT